MTKTKTRRFAALLFAICVPFLKQDIRADDFARIVHYLEAGYHVHRNYRFLMAVTGVAVKCSHVGGVKTFKAALFEDQHLDASQLDERLDELVERASSSGWQPLVKSVSRHSGEHTYIYAQTKGKDLNLLLVSVEPQESVVLQLKLDPANLNVFINEHTRQAR
jgi:hypothetical protein